MRARLALFALVATACATTHLSDTWRDASYRGPPLHRIIVFGMSRDPTARRIFEDTFAAELESKGVLAIRSYTVLPGQGKPSEAEVQNAVHSSGADGAVLTNLVGITHRATVVPGYVGPGPFLLGGPFWPDYYGTWGFVYAPGYLRTDTVVRLSTRLYAAHGNGRLLWSGDSATLNPSSVRSLAMAVIGRVVDRLLDHHLIG